MKTRIVLITLVSLIIAACASSNPYRAANNSGYGYAEEKLSEDRYRITFKMHGDDAGKANDYAMRRAAEMTLLEGKEWFVVTNRTNDIEREKSTSSTIGTASTVSRDCGLVGCKTRVTPGSPATVHTAPTREKIKTFLEIRIGAGAKPEAVEVYDAQSVRSGS